jgi:phosphoglycerol transferase MdoB-like AlkP superfamily enzyme
MSAITVVSSPNWKDRATARSARYVVRDIGSIYYLVNVTIYWFAKTVDATDYKFFNLSSSKEILLFVLILYIRRAGIVMSAEC